MHKVVQRRRRDAGATCYWTDNASFATARCGALAELCPVNATARIVDLQTHCYFLLAHHAECDDTAHSSYYNGGTGNGAALLDILHGTRYWIARKMVLI